MIDYSSLDKERLRSFLDAMGSKRTSDSAPKLGTCLREFRQAVQLSQAQLAQKLGVHENTVRRWENGDNAPPLRKILLLRQVFGLDELATSSIPILPDKHGDICVIENTPLAVRSIGYLLEKETQARTVWVLRSNTPFLSAYPGPAQSLMLHLLETTPIEYRFLCQSASLGSEFTRAYTSHLSFIDAVLKREQMLAGLNKKERRERNTNLRARVKGWVVDKGDAETLGIGVGFVSSVLMYYRKEHVLQHGRHFDIFIEIPVASYDATRPEVLAASKTKAWLQLAPEHGHDTRQRWLEIMLKNEGDWNPETGVYERMNEDWIRTERERKPH